MTLKDRTLFHQTLRMTTYHTLNLVILLAHILCVMSQALDS